MRSEVMKKGHEDDVMAVLVVEPILIQDKMYLKNNVTVWSVAVNVAVGLRSVWE